MTEIKRKTRKQDEAPVVLENKRPSDNFIKRAPPPHVIKRVTEKEIMAMQDPKNPDPNLMGFRPHTVNNQVPVNMTSGKIIPDVDGTIGEALMRPQKKEE